MVEELDSLCVQREIVGSLVEKELNGPRIQFQRQRFEKRDVVSKQFFVGEVESMYDEIVDVVIGEQVEDGGLARDVLNENT